jgi:archaemetzincin
MATLALAAGLTLCGLSAAIDDRETVALVPLGAVDERILREIGEAIVDELHVRIRIEPQREMPERAWYPPRSRHRAQAILDAMAEWEIEDAFRVIAVTEKEISARSNLVPDWGVGGLGMVGGRYAVVSTFLVRRASRTDSDLFRRARALALHEVGHTLGMPHCGVFACLMRDAQGKLIRSLDLSTGRWCGRCRRRVPPELLVRDRPLLAGEPLNESAAAR